jgi:hypothetical protein
MSSIGTYKDSNEKKRETIMSLDSFLVEEKNHEHEACAFVSVQE